MEFLRKIIEKINSSPLLRNVVLFVCGLIVLAFVTSMLLNLFTRHNSYITVPEFTGLELSEAQHLARKADLKLEVSDSTFVVGCAPGMVLDQLPSMGREVKSGRRIFITINAHTRKMVDVPYVTGYSLRQAKNNIQIAGLEIEKLIYEPDIATNYVLRETYRGKVITQGSKVQAEMGTGVTLVVGKGEDAGYCKVPKLVGYSLTEAKSRLWEVGLNVGKIEFDGDISDVDMKDARVLLQRPEQGAYEHLGTEVSVKLSLDTEAVAKGVKASDAAAKHFVAPPKTEEQVAEEE